MSSRYDKARAAFEYLESLASLDDQVELDAERENLMRNPTKAKAADLYEMAIRLWAGEHSPHTDRRARKICEEYDYV
jgi:hypothetical protein